MAIADVLSRLDEIEQGEKTQQDAVGLLAQSVPTSPAPAQQQQPRRALSTIDIINAAENIGQQESVEADRQSQAIDNTSAITKLADTARSYAAGSGELLTQAGKAVEMFGRTDAAKAGVQMPEAVAGMDTETVDRLSGAVASMKPGQSILQPAADALTGAGRTTSEYWDDSMSEGGKALGKMAWQDAPGASNKLHAAVLGAARSAPQTVAIGFAGKALTGVLPVAEAIPHVAKGLTRIGLPSGFANKAAEWMTSGAIYGGAEGLSAGLSNANQVGEEIDKMSIESLSAKSPKFNEYIAQVDPSIPQEERAAIAKGMLKEDAESMALWATAGLSTVTGSVAGAGIFDKALSSKKFLLDRALGGLKEAHQEFWQSGLGEKLPQNIAMQQADQGIGSMDDVWHEGVAGAGPGAIMGLVAGGGGHGKTDGNIDPSAVERNQVAAQIERMNLPTRDLIAIRNGEWDKVPYAPDLLKNSGLTPAHIDGILENRANEMSVARFTLESDINQGPLVRAATMATVAAEDAISRDRARRVQQEKDTTAAIDALVGQYNPSAPAPTERTNRTLWPAVDQAPATVQDIADRTMQGEWDQQEADTSRYLKLKNEKKKPGRVISAEEQAFMRAYDDSDNTPENRAAWPAKTTAEAQGIADRKMQGEWDQQEQDAINYLSGRFSTKPAQEKKTDPLAAEKERFDESYNAVGTVPESKGNVTDEEAARHEQKVQEYRRQQRNRSLVKAYNDQKKDDEELLNREDVPDDVKRESVRQAQEIVKADPVYQHMAEAKKRGKLNLAAMGQDYDRDTIGMINRRYPAIFSLVGSVKPDEFANEMGYESLDAMVRRFSEARTQKELTAQIAREKMDEWQRADAEQGEFFANKAERIQGREWAGAGRAATRKTGTVFPAPEEAVASMEAMIKSRPDLFTDADLEHWTFTAGQQARLRQAHQDATGAKDFSGPETSDNTEQAQQPEFDVAQDATGMPEKSDQSGLEKPSVSASPAGYNPARLDPSSNKSLSNGTTGNSKAGGNIGERGTVPSHINSPVNVPGKTSELVEQDVFPLGHNNEVTDRVVESVPVDVVNDLSGTKSSPEGTLHDKSVLESLPPDSVNGNTDKAVETLVPGEVSDMSTGRRTPNPTHDNLSKKEEGKQRKDTSGSSNLQQENGKIRGSQSARNEQQTDLPLTGETQRADQQPTSTQGEPNGEERQGQGRREGLLEEELAATSDEDLTAMLDDVFGDKEKSTAQNAPPKPRKTAKEQTHPATGKAGIGQSHPVPGRENVNFVIHHSRAGYEQNQGKHRAQVSPQDSRKLSTVGYGATEEAAYDQALARFDEAHQNPAKQQKPKQTTTQPKTAGQITKEGGIAALDGVKSAMEGLGQLFGGKNRLGSGLAFDEETYAQAKPHFVKAWNDAKQVGYSLKELITYFHDQFGKAIRPYLERFLADVKSGNLTVEQEGSTVNQGDTTQQSTKGGNDGPRADNEGTDRPDATGSLRQDDTAVEGAGDNALDAVPAEILQRPEETGQAADNGGEGSREGAGGNQGADGSRIPAPRGGRGGSTKVHPSARGTRNNKRDGRQGSLTDTPATIPAKNFVITPDLQLGKGGEVAKFNDNLAAITTMKTIQREQRRATPDEQRILARYVGWGGLANAFKNPSTGEVKKGWEEKAAELESLLNPQELATARNSTQNAHYTSQDVVSAIWSGLQRLGFSGGIALEPSVGTGNFLGLVPQELAGQTKFVAAEFDHITAGIAKMLYPQEAVFHTPFEKLPLPSNEFDLVIGNPPFGQTRLNFAHQPYLNRHTIHNQFFLAGIEALKPGGVQAFVVSRYLMDAKDPSVRRELAKRAKLLGAIRLPETAFKENARTEVVTDIIFLQKHPSDHNAVRFDSDGKEIKPPPYVDPAWVETVQIADEAGQEPITINSHFAMHPEMIVGTLGRTGSMHRDNDVDVSYEGNDFKGDLQKAINRALPAGEIQSTKASNSQQLFEKMAESLHLSLTGAEDGSVLINDQGELVHVHERLSPSGEYMLTKRTLSPESPWSASLTQTHDGKWFEEVDKVNEKGEKVKRVVNGKTTNLNEKTKQYYDNDAAVPVSKRLGKVKYDRLRDAVGLLELVKEQIRLESITTSTDKEIEGNRNKLNRAYDVFVDKHGHTNSSTVAGVVSDVPNGALLLALEKSYSKPISRAASAKSGLPERPGAAEKASILSRRVIFPPVEITEADSANDALAINLSESGVVELERIASLLGKTEQEVVKELHDNTDTPLIFFDPELQRWEKADEYLGGNVVRKLNAAKEAGLDKNIAALEQIKPEPWGADKVTVLPGATWVPESVYGDFVTHLTGSPGRVRFQKLTNTFYVTADDSATAASNWRTRSVSVAEIVDAMLNSKTIRVTYYDRESRSTVFDQEATDLANMKVAEVRDEFASWVFKDGERRRQLVEVFNQKYNVRVLKQRDGQHLKLPGKVPDTLIRMRRHQLNAIWRGIVDRFVLYDHAVGAGKTFTGIARAMERRRMGLSQKPMIVVPNHLVEQFAADVYRLYPNAKVLAAGKKDMEKKKRRRLFAKIATGDWDAVIVPHSSFAFIGIDQATETRYLEAELAVAEAAVLEAEEAAIEEGFTGPRKPLSVKQAEALRDRILKRLESLRDGGNTRDRLLTFEQLGVDDLTIDEAHEFKNLFYTSRLQARGMNPRAGSAKAYDLWTKVRVLRESHGSVAFMTGTPISNSAVEMYTMMRYLAADELAEMDIEHFDAWRSQFVDATTEFEPTESGRGLKEVLRLGRDWSNMRALMDMYYTFSDSVTNEDIQKWYKEDNEGKEFPIPRVKDGGRAGVNVTPTPLQKQMLDDIVAGFEGLPDIEDIDERNRTRLRLMDAARKVSIDVRAIDPTIKSDEKGGKLEVVSQRIAEIYNKWNSDKGTQLVFLDRSIPRARGDKKKLAEYDKKIEALREAERSGDESEERRAQEALDKYDHNEMAEIRLAQESDWNAYDQIKKNLVAQGIPENEIRYIHEANTDEQKQELFDAVNSGTIRVFIGNTPRMGAGTNVQERLVALHHVDVTWKPSDIEQREGRIIRQGNKLLEKYGMDKFEVEVLAYTTEYTIDAKLWSLNATKLKMINGIRQYNGEFNMEFDDNDSVSMAEIAAIASGDPLQLERVKLDAEIRKLARQKSAFDRQRWGVQDAVDSAERILRETPSTISVYEKLAQPIADAITKESAEAEKRTVTIDGKVFAYSSLTLVGEENPYRYVAIKRDQAKEDGEKFSVEINGDTTRSMDKVDEKITAALGDEQRGRGAFAKLPFDLSINGERFYSRDGARRKIAELANVAIEGKPDDMGETKVGTVIVHGLPFELSVETEATRDKRGEPVKAVTFYFEHEVKNEDGGRPHRIHAYQSGTVLRINNKVNINSLGNLFEIVGKVETIQKELDNMRARLKRAQEELPALKEQANVTFPKAQELADKESRLDEVERELASRVPSNNTATPSTDNNTQLSKSQSVPTSNRADIEGELRSSLGGIRTRRLFNSGRVVIVDSQKEMQGIIDGAKNPAVKHSQDGAIQGAYVNGVSYLVRDGIAKGQAFPVLLHELGEHANQLGFSNDADYQSILKSLERRKDVKGATGDAIRAAMAKVPTSTKQEHYWSEVAAYLIEQNANAELSIVDRIKAFFKKWLIKVGITSPDTLSHKDLVIFARAAVNAASGGNAVQSTMLSVREAVNFKPVDVNSAAFRRWFGKSKITKDGQPHILYHGTRDPHFLKDAEYPWIFDTNRPKNPENSNLSGLGIFLGGMDAAEMHAGFNGTVHPFYVRMEKPYVTTSAELEKKVEASGAEAFRRRLQDLNGHDGIIIKDRGHAVVFDPNQVKSAEQNTGEFSRSNPDVRYSMTSIDNGGQLPSWEAPPVDSKADTFLYNAQDKLIDMKRIQDNIEKALGPIQEHHDVRLAEELYHKRSAKRVEDVLVSEVNPLMKELGEIKDADLSEFEEYMHALHAPEANESLRQRNPNEQELQALKEQAKADRDNLQKSAIVQRFIAKERELASAERDVESGDADDSLVQVVSEELESLRDEPVVAQYIKAREKHRKIRNAKPYLGDNTALSGMSNDAAEEFLAKLPADRAGKYQALAKKWRQFMDKTRSTLVQYELESRETVDGWAEAFEHYVPLHREDMENGMGIGQGFSVKGSATRSRTGSNRKVVDILAYIVAQRERAIVRGEKAAISRALYGLAAANPNPEVWTIETPPMVREFDQVTGLVVSRPDPNYKNKANAVVHRFVNEKGHIEERAVLFNEQSERGMRLAQALKNLDTEQLGTILRTSAILTRWFSAINTQYNLVFGPVNAIRDAGSAMLHLTGTQLAGRQAQVAKRIATSIKPLFKAIWAEASGKPIDTEIAKAWREMQLEGGTTGFRDMFENADARANDLKRAMLSTTKSRLAARFNWVKQQVSQYNDVMENVSRLAVYMEAKSQGLSNAKAASLAKNITLNFNRKGKIAAQAGAMYAFFNASMQGTEKMYRTMKGPAGKKILAGGLILGAAQAVLLAAAGFSDDEPPEFIKERALIIPVGGSKKYVTIPMPLGFNVIPNIARVATEWALSGGKNTGDRVTSLVGSFAETFNPIGNAGFSVQTIAPTVIDPLIALSENKDWTGKPIAKQNFNTLKPTPGHERMKDTASAVGVGLSRALNFLSGGTEYTPGLLSPTPDQIDYLIGQALGGVGRETLKAAQVARSTVTGEELPVYKIPLVSRFYGDSSDSSSVSTAFYRNVKRMNMHAAEMDGLAENRGDVAGYIASNPDAKHVRRTEATYNRLQRLQKTKRALLKSDAPKEQIKSIETAITSLMSSYNQAIEM